MNKNNNCRQDRFEGCPGGIPGGRSPEKAGSSLMKRNNNCRQDRSESRPPDILGGRFPEKVGCSLMNKSTDCGQDRSKSCPAALSARTILSYPCALSVMSGTDVVLNLSWVCAYRVTTLLSLVEAVAWL